MGSYLWGGNESDVKASMYNADLMIEFAKFYHKKKLTLQGVNKALKDKEEDDFKEWLKENKYTRVNSLIWQNKEGYWGFIGLFRKYKRERIL